MAKEKQIKIIDRVNRMDKIDWKTMLSIRNDDLKQHTDAQLEKLEQSLIHNGFIEPFAAWQDPKSKDIYTINGHTRKKRLLALIEKGYSIPGTLSAFFIDCKSLNDAASILPLYESKYGNLDVNKLDEFKITFDLDETKVKGSDIDEFFISHQEVAPQIDYSILIGQNSNDQKIANLQSSVMRAIQIEFEPSDYEQAFEIIKQAREKDIYIGKILVEKLKEIVSV